MPRLEKQVENKIIKNIRNLSRIKKEIDNIAMKDIRNLFRRKMKTKKSKTVIRDTGNLFEH